jgi:hypothetical protein
MPIAFQLCKNCIYRDNVLYFNVLDVLADLANNKTNTNHKNTKEVYP